jgi:hypothetical protein
MKKEIMFYTSEGKIAFLSSIFFLFFLFLIRGTSNPEWIGTEEMIKIEYLDAIFCTGLAFSFEFCLWIAPKSLSTTKSQINMFRVGVIFPWTYFLFGLHDYLTVYFRFSDYSEYYLFWYINLFFLVLLMFFFIFRAEKFRKKEK